MAGFSYIDETNWKYTNLGTADLLSSSGTTISNLSENQSKTGSAFYQTTRAKCFDIPATSEIWIRFDVYFDGSNRWRAYNGSANGDTGITAQTGSARQLSFFANDKSVGKFDGILKTQLQSVLLHMISDSKIGIVEAWIDGEKIYTYTGNVNNGEDFADIYLQSDGSGTYFSNVLISNIQNPPISRRINIQPKIYISALIDLPTAEIDINPKIYAVVVMKPPPAEVYVRPEIYGTILMEAPSAEIDIQPEIWAVIQPQPRLEQTNADTFRQVGISNAAIADTSRELFKPAVPRHPAVISPNLYVSAVPKDPAVISPLVFATGVPINPAVIAPLVFVAMIDSRETAIADTSRIVENKLWGISDTAVADTSRRLIDVATADTLRQIIRPESTCADTLIRYPHDLIFDVASGIDTFSDYDLTLFSFTLNERTLSDTYNLETARHFEINDAVKGRFLDYTFSFLVEETSQRDLIQSVKGMYDIDKLLYTQVFCRAIALGNNETFFVSASGYVAQLARFFGLTANIKIQDFTPYHDFTSTNVTYRDLINTVFGWTSRLPQRQINVFIRGETLHCIQRGMEDSVFDISTLPHSRTTISRRLIRSMYNNPAGQYTSKPNPLDPESPIPINYPKRKGPLEGYWEDEEIANPFSGPIRFEAYGCSTKLIYSNGYLVYEESKTKNGKVEASSKTTYSYKIWDEAGYITSKKTESSAIQYNEDGDKSKVTTTDTTVYVYRSAGDDLYLYKEHETNKRCPYDWNGEKWELDEYDSGTNDRQTFHIPVGNGWYATSVYLNGEPQGASLSQGKPGNKVSPYTINQVQRIFKDAEITPEGEGEGSGGGGEPASGGGGEPASGGGGSGNNGNAYEDWRRQLSPIVDTSFPVRELNMLFELTSALYWLNRKVQETVSIDIVDEISVGVPSFNHVVDFTERVKLDGAEYFLVSNSVSLTPRKLIQRLQLVRWY